jgi:hypothetical protein
VPALDDAAERAVKLLAAFLAAKDKATREEIDPNGAGQEFHDFLVRWFASVPDVSAVLTRFQEEPGNPTVAAALHGRISEALLNSREFAAQLDAALARVSSARAPGVQQIVLEGHAVAVNDVDSKVSIRQRSVKIGRLNIPLPTLIILLLLLGGGVVAGGGATLIPPPSADKPSAPPESRPSLSLPSTPSSSFSSLKDAVILLYCGPQDVTLQAVSAQNGQLLASTQEIALSNGARLAYGCGNGGSTQTLRQMFDKDFTMVAVQTWGPNQAGLQAHALSLSTGTTIGSGGGNGAFQSAPDDGPVVIARGSGELWYVDRSSLRLKSRLPNVSRSDAKDHGAVKDSDSNFQLAGDTPWFPSTSIAINPSGTYAVGTYAVAFNTDGVFLLQGDNPTSQDHRLRDVPANCGVDFWIDDHRFVCTHSIGTQSLVNWATNFVEVALSSDFSSVTAVRPLLPDTDRNNASPVLSPDQRSIAFISRQGDQVALFRQDLASGAQPRKIVDISPDQHHNHLPDLIEWR